MCGYKRKRGVTKKGIKGERKWGLRKKQREKEEREGKNIEKK